MDGPCVHVSGPPGSGLPLARCRVSREGRREELRVGKGKRVEVRQGDGVGRSDLEPAGRGAQRGTVSELLRAAAAKKLRFYMKHVGIYSMWTCCSRAYVCVCVWVRAPATRPCVSYAVARSRSYFRGVTLLQVQRRRQTLYGQ